MRIWLNPSTLVSFGLTPVNVKSAIQTQTCKCRPGRSVDADLK
ncbi:RND efflux system, inner membrane transporter CmeB [Pseudomonas sp. R1-43-08]|nr:RND efflux system, inner membrane transporter CmeB [Pseudomonas sp. R1-43-08]